MKRVTLSYGLLLVVGLSSAQLGLPATGPSGTVCESAGGSCKGIASGRKRSFDGDCTKFITCHESCGCDMKCPDGLHFNSKLQVCDWPTSAGCDPSYVNLKPGQEQGSGQGTGLTPGTGNATWRCETLGESCIGLRNQVSLPSKDDCSKYIVCMDGCETHKDCSEGLHYNSKLGICDWPAQAGCDPSYSTLKPGGGDESGQGSGQGSGQDGGEGSSQGSGQESGQGGNQGSGEDSGHGTGQDGGQGTSDGNGQGGSGSGNGTCQFSGTLCVGIQNSTVLPHKSACSKFVVCIEGCETYQECPAGLHFNSKLVICDWPINAGCDPLTDSGQEAGTGTGQGSGQEPGQGSGSQPGLTNDTSHCLSSGVLCIDQKNQTILSHKTNCSQYVVCVDGCETYKECPTGMHFSKELGVCDWPNNAGCSLEDDSTTGSGSGPLIPCDGKDDGKLLVLTGSCIKFIACYNGLGLEFYCNKGLHFDKNNEICALPEDVGCDETIKT